VTEIAHDVDAETFAREHLIPRWPTVVRGALGHWAWTPPWSFEGLGERFGALRVPLYDTLFSLDGISTLARYLDRFTGTDDDTVPPYLRWFARQGPERLPWADEAFDALASEWSQPSWLPDSEYILPRTEGRVDAARDPFPAKGIFICGQGGRTRLHIDPWHSDACLCQATGRKRIVVFARRDAALLGAGEELVDFDHPDDTRFPRWREASPVIDQVLEPGDAAYIPAGWPHTAIALSDSCSLTWNFVHRVHAEPFERFLRGGGDQNATVRWFRDRR
jgi:hypothetical protein